MLWCRLVPLAQIRAFKTTSTVALLQQQSGWINLPKHSCLQQQHCIPAVVALSYSEVCLICRALRRNWLGTMIFA
jgi:hypothetical protein